MEEESRQIQDIVNLLHLLSFTLWEGGGRVGIEVVVEEEEDNDSAMMTN